MYYITEVHCSPKHVKRAIFEGAEETKVGQQALIKCEHGFKFFFNVSEFNLTCTDTGEWSPELQSEKCQGMLKLPIIKMCLHSENILVKV